MGNIWYNVLSTLCAKQGGVILEDRVSELISDEMSRKIVDVAEKIATLEGAEKVTVRKILQRLEITNRVFYNRFHNVEEVLAIVYENMVVKIRASVSSSFDPDGDFFEQVIDIVANTLILSYETKMNLNSFVFENDSISNINYEWWKSEIKKIIELGKKKRLLKDVDSEIMSYAIWCFIRGYNADAIGRKLPKEESVSNFKYCFGILLDGMKA